MGAAGFLTAGAMRTAFGGLDIAGSSAADAGGAKLAIAKAAKVASTMMKRGLLIMTLFTPFVVTRISEPHTPFVVTRISELHTPFVVARISEPHPDHGAT